MSAFPTSERVRKGLLGYRQTIGWGKTVRVVWAPDIERAVIEEYRASLPSGAETDLDGAVRSRGVIFETDPQARPGTVYFFEEAS